MAAQEGQMVDMIVERQNNHDFNKDGAYHEKFNRMYPFTLSGAFRRDRGIS